MSTSKRERPASTIMLPVERIAQLRTLAAAQGTTITDLIENFINERIEAGELPDQIPGYEVHVADDHVWIVAGDFGFPALTPKEARAIAVTLDHYASGSEGRAHAFKVGAAGEIVLKIGRKGRGILFGGEDRETEREHTASMTPGMARDLARIIRRAAASSH